MDLFKNYETPTVVTHFGARAGFLYVFLGGPVQLLVVLGMGVPATLHAFERGASWFGLFIAILTALATVGILRVLLWVFRAAQSAKRSEAQA